jgi:hypothetical protein
MNWTTLHTKVLPSLLGGTARHPLPGDLIRSSTTNSDGALEMRPLRTSPFWFSFLARNDPPAVPPEKTTRETARTELADKMLVEVQKGPKNEAGISAGGLVLRFYRSERLGELALVSFDIENTTSNVIDLEDPRLNLVTAAEKSKDHKKGAASKIEPIELAQSEVSAKQLRPGERAVCVIAFKPPVHDSDQRILLSVANRAMADHPATYRVE